MTSKYEFGTDDRENHSIRWEGTVLTRCKNLERNNVTLGRMHR